MEMVSGMMAWRMRSGDLSGRKVVKMKVEGDGREWKKVWVHRLPLSLLLSFSLG